MTRRRLLHAGLQLNLFDFELPSILKPAPPSATAPSAPSSPPAPQTHLPAPPPAQKPRRMLQAQGQRIEYELRRSRRRSIGFMIEDSGLLVTAPRWVTLAEIEEAIRSKQRWIVSKLQANEERLRQQAAARIRWQDGATLPFLGKPLALRLLQDGANGIDAAAGCMTLALSPDATEDRIRQQATQCLQEAALHLFTARLSFFAEKMGVRYRTIALSTAQTQWGSCTAQGKIRLNWRLIHLPPALIDYVVVHELAHLREMNHGEKFWRTVESALPDYRDAKKALRNHAPDNTPSM